MAMHALFNRLFARLQSFRRAQAGNVAMAFGLTLFALAGVTGAAVDYSRANSVRADLQAALDATALMLAKQASTLTAPQLQQNATDYFNSVFNRPEALNPTVTPSYTATPPTVTVSGTTSIKTVIMALANIPSINISASATVTYGPPKTISMNVVFDSSASMIVGATQNDVNLIANWVTKNWNMVKPGDPPPNYPAGDNPPCAFACHDVGGSTGPADIAAGLTNAHSAGATTRFDVMVAAGQQLITHVKDEVNNNPQLKYNTYLWNVLSMDSTLNTWGSANTDFTGASNAIGMVSPGLDTHLFTTMPQLLNKVGTQGDGTSSATPLKFVILITDGLQSDRGQNWNCKSGWHWDGKWNYNTCYGGYASPIDLNQCQQFKDAGLILAVLETPYVPLTGQSPKVAPYEKTVRHVVFPGGPNTASAISQALASCASNGFYFQATSSADISTGFLALTDKFLTAVPYLSK